MKQVKALYASEPTENASIIPAMDSATASASWTFSTSSAQLSTSNPVTITITGVSGDEPVQDPGQNMGAWESVLAVEGSPSSDRRYLIPGEIGARDLPLPLRVVTSDEGGHANAVQVGRIETIDHIPLAEFSKADSYNLDGLPDGAIIVFAEGVFDGPEDAVEIAQTMIRNGAGVSVDLPHDRLALIDPETFEEVPEDEIDMVDVLSGKYLTGIGGKIAAATIVDIPAFEEASVRLREENAVVASAYGIRLREALLASSGRAPLAPPKAWFEMPEAKGPTPLTVTDDGHIYGHLALWNQCHASFDETCQLAPRSKSGYSLFHLGSLVTEEGETISVGRITVGRYDIPGGHLWDMYAGPEKAIAHYDQTGRVAAFVRAKDGKHGIWLSGATNSAASPEMIRDLRANPPSGDWRWEKGGFELVAALSVPVPGYAVPYPLLVAAAGDQPVAMIALGYVEDEEKSQLTRSEQRKLTSLVSKMRSEFAPNACPDCAMAVPQGATECPGCGFPVMSMMDDEASEGEMDNVPVTG